MKTIYTKSKTSVDFSNLDIGDKFLLYDEDSEGFIKINSFINSYDLPESEFNAVSMETGEVTFILDFIHVSRILSMDFIQ